MSHPCLYHTSNITSNLIECNDIDNDVPLSILACIIHQIQHPSLIECNDIDNDNNVNLYNSSP